MVPEISLVLVLMSLCDTCGTHGEPGIVQTFNSCTSRPGVCQCPLVQTPMNNMSENKPSTPVTHVA